MRLKNLPNDLKKTSYTYDFDGKVYIKNIIINIINLLIKY